MGLSALKTLALGLFAIATLATYPVSLVDTLLSASFHFLLNRFPLRAVSVVHHLKTIVVPLLLLGFFLNWCKLDFALVLLFIWRCRGESTLPFLPYIFPGTLDRYVQIFLYTLAQEAADDRLHSKVGKLATTWADSSLGAVAYRVIEPIIFTALVYYIDTNLESLWDSFQDDQQTSLRPNALERILNLDPFAYEKADSEGLVEVIAADLSVYSLIKLSSAPAVRNLRIIIITLRHLRTGYGLFVFLATLVSIVTVVLLLRPTTESWEQQLKYEENVAAEFQARLSALRRWEVANSLNTQADELNRYTRVVNSACKALRKKKHSEIELERIKTWVLNIGGMIAGVVALFEFRGNKEALVELTLLTIRWRRFTGAIVFFASLSKRTGHQWAKVRNYLDLVSLPCRRDGSQPLKVEGGRIKVKGLYFSYKEHQVLKGIDMDIRPGETVAIIGASGMGKSTLFSLLMRLRDIPEGCIWIDNQDIHDVTATSLRESLGLVPQEFQQTGNTIRENIVYGRANASQQEVRDACMKACILDDIEKLPAKYDTPINNISAGQKQRIGLARILLRNPQILLLDESTSALDANTEYEIKRSLRKHYSKLTTLIIGHRLATVKDADHIYVLGDGIIIEHGTHQELIQKQGTYAGMWSKLQ